MFCCKGVCYYNDVCCISGVFCCKGVCYYNDVCCSLGVLLYGCVLLLGCVLLYGCVFLLGLMLLYGCALLQCCVKRETYLREGKLLSYLDTICSSSSTSSCCSSYTRLDLPIHCNSICYRYLSYIQVYLQKLEFRLHSPT